MIMYAIVGTLFLALGWLVIGKPKTNMDSFYCGISHAFGLVFWLGALIEALNN
jgi:hypothetical protein